ncbi:MAG: DUF6482 family protein [Pseudomonadota bacterium]
MKITIVEFAALTSPIDVVIHSLEQALYQVTVQLPSGTSLLVDKKGKIIRHRNLAQVREMLQVLPVASITLRHESAYDEMIGQPVREQSNALEVKLSQELYPEPVIH